MINSSFQVHFWIYGCTENSAKIPILESFFLVLGAIERRHLY